MVQGASSIQQQLSGASFCPARNKILADADAAPHFHQLARRRTRQLICQQ